MKRLGLLGALLLIAAAGCGDDAAGDDDDSVDASAVEDPDAAAGAPDAAANDPDAGPPDAAPQPDAGVVDPGGDHYQYVANNIDVPTNSSEAAALGQDIDGDPSAMPDNALGQIMASLASIGGADPQAAVNLTVANGEMLQLLDVQASDLVTASGIGVSIFIGEDGDMPANPADNFSGSEMFNIKSGTPTEDPLAGAITGGQVRAGPGTVPLQLVLVPGTTPVVVSLVGARVRGDVTATTISNGLLGGAIREEEVDTVVIPAIAVAMNALVAADCPGGVCTPDSGGETILALFDTNTDGTVTADELRANDLINSLLAPDVDLFDGAGNFNPRVDGVRDSLSFGVGFTAVGAVFDLP
jgi:hypothetical protein